MRRILTPGVPSWPPLMMDVEKRQAIISALYADWLSEARGKWATEVAVAINYFVCGWIAWKMVPPYEDVVLRGLAILVIYGILSGFMTKALRITLPGFLARRVFATRLRVWMTHRDIAIKCRLYQRGIIVPRQWNGQRYQIRFIAQPDEDATAHQQNQQSGTKMRPGYLAESKMVHLMIRTPDTPRDAVYMNTDYAMRSYPVASVRVSEVSKFTVVLNAAAMGTEGEPQSSSIQENLFGRDIDGAL